MAAAVIYVPITANLISMLDIHPKILLQAQEVMEEGLMLDMKTRVPAAGAHIPNIFKKISARKKSQTNIIIFD